MKEASDFVSDKVIPGEKSSIKIDEKKERNYGSIQSGGKIGVLYIPRIDRETPIVEGIDEEELAQGVGHY